MNITLKNGTSLTADVLGGKEQYQNARREYLEFVLPQEGNTVEVLEAALSPEACAAITLTDAEGAQFLHEGYVLRGSVRVFCDDDGVWKIGIRRYQQTALEMEVAALRQEVAAMAARGA